MFTVIKARDVPIIRSAIGNTLYRLIFSYWLSDRYVYQISSKSDIIGRSHKSTANQIFEGSFGGQEAIPCEVDNYITAAYCLQKR